MIAKEQLTESDKKVIDAALKQDDIYITVRKAAEVTGLTVDEIYKMVRERKIKALRPNGNLRGKIYTKKSWIDEYLEKLLIKEETGSGNPYEGIVIIK